LAALILARDETEPACVLRGHVGTESRGPSSLPRWVKSSGQAYARIEERIRDVDDQV